MLFVSGSFYVARAWADVITTVLYSKASPLAGRENANAGSLMRYAEDGQPQTAGSSFALDVSTDNLSAAACVWPRAWIRRDVCRYSMERP